MQTIREMKIGVPPLNRVQFADNYLSRDTEPVHEQLSLTDPTARRHVNSTKYRRALRYNPRNASWNSA